MDTEQTDQVIREMKKALKQTRVIVWALYFMFLGLAAVMMWQFRMMTLMLNEVRDVERRIYRIEERAGGGGRPEAAAGAGSVPAAPDRSGGFGGDGR